MMKPKSWAMVGWIAFRRRVAILLLLAFISIITIVALIGMHPTVGWVSSQESMFLVSINLLGMSAYFRWLCPERDNVSKIITSGLAILAAGIALATVQVVITLSWGPYLEMAGVASLLILTLVIWAWYDLFVLHSFADRIEEITDVVSFLEDFDRTEVEDGDDDGNT